MQEVIEYPYIVQLETSTICSGKCSFCPRASNKRFKQLSMEFITSLLRQMASWPVTLRDFCCFLNNDPFEDHRIVEILRKVSTLLPSTNLIIFTKGNLLTMDVQRDLVWLKNTKQVYVSLHNIDPVVHHSITGCHFSDVANNIDDLCSFVSERFSVNVLRVSDGNTADDRLFMEYCAKRWPKAGCSITPMYNWIGSIKSKFSTPSQQYLLDNVCPRLGAIYINAEGDTPVCCMDFHADYSLGSVFEQTLLEIYNSEKAKLYRRTPRKNSTPCNICNMIW